MVRYSVTLPDWFERKLRLWAKFKGTNRATLTANIVQARIEANWADIEKELEEIAKHHGKTLEELQAEWLNGGEEGD